MPNQYVQWHIPPSSQLFEHCFLFSFHFFSHPQAKKPFIFIQLLHLSHLPLRGTGVRPQYVHLWLNLYLTATPSGFQSNVGLVPCLSVGIRSLRESKRTAVRHQTSSDRRRRRVCFMAVTSRTSHRLADEHKRSSDGVLARHPPTSCSALTSVRVHQELQVHQVKQPLVQHMWTHLQYQFDMWNPVRWHLRHAVRSNKGSSVDISKCPVSSQNDSTTFPVLLCLSVMSSLPCPGWVFFLCDVTFFYCSSQTCMKTRNLTDSWDSQIWCWHLTHTPNVKSIYRARGEASAASSITIQFKQVMRPSRESNAAHLHLMSH